VRKLSALAERGVRTIVDPTVVGLGRYIPRIQRIAEQVPELNIVAATGCYTYTDVPFFFHYRGPALNAIVGAEVPDPMVDLFVTDITDGIAGTGVRAGLLKCAIDHQGLTPGVERVMRAVAKAHRRTGTPITVHTHPTSETALHIQRVMCDEEGVDPRRVVLGHSGDTTDVDHLSALADAGFILGMDRFGINIETTFEARADTLVEMCRRGYAGQMVLSQDASCFIDWIDPGEGDADAVDLPAHRGGRAALRAGTRRHRGADHHHAGGRSASILRERRALLTPLEQVQNGSREHSAAPMWTISANTDPLSNMTPRSGIHSGSKGRGRLCR